MKPALSLDIGSHAFKIDQLVSNLPQQKKEPSLIDQLVFMSINKLNRLLCGFGEKGGQRGQLLWERFWG